MREFRWIAPPKKRYDPRILWQRVSLGPLWLLESVHARGRANLPSSGIRDLVPEPALIVRKLMLGRQLRILETEVPPHIAVLACFQHLKATVIRTWIGGVRSLENYEVFIAIEERVERAGNHHIKIDADD